MARLFYNEQELLKRPTMPGMHDPTHLYYHFRPARPANLVVSRDPLSGEYNISAGTFGVLTESPFTICLHISKHSFDTQRNLTKVGTECVVCLPGNDTIDETWWTALPIPRGIFEADVANFNLLPSQVVSVPGIVECPVNLECVVEVVKDWFSHWAIFLKVVGASLNDCALNPDRLEMIREFPTYEVDDQTNTYGGAIERLGVNGELLICPHVNKLTDFEQLELLSCNERGMLAQLLRAWKGEWQEGKEVPLSSLQADINYAFELIAWEEWDTLRDFLGAKMLDKQVEL